MASDGKAKVVDGLPVEEKRTLVVHMVAGPGAGKTTAAYEVCCALKKLGYSVEYAPERAKELVADGQGALLAEGSLATQRELCAEQQRRIDRWVGKVDFVVTDSAPILGLQYLKEEGPEAEEFARRSRRPSTRRTTSCSSSSAAGTTNRLAACRRARRRSP